ncbi:hypothetical protein ACOSP7_028262 [Xanthoceras sorbifolium]
MKKKKQDALFASSTSSSSRRENSTAKTIGCMSGFFQLVFNYNNRRRHRKFLTSGKKQEKKTSGPVSLCEERENRSRIRLRCDVDRSPMLGVEYVEEKRNKLLEALGKCDDDLKALKKMIELAHAHHLQPTSLTNGGAIQQQIQKQKKKPGEDEMMSNISLVDRMKTQAKPFWISNAMIDSVNEVSRDISWGEKREIGRIGLALQDFICRDLIEEFVRDYSCCMYSLPFDACKRRLLF